MTLGVAIAEIDAAGDAHIVCSNAESAPTRLDLNDGSGVFAVATFRVIATPLHRVRGFAVTDVHLALTRGTAG